MGSPTYWRLAREWARANTKTYTLPKALPPILAAAAQHWLLHLRPVTQTLAIIGTILGGYALLYLLDITWKLLFRSPAVLYIEGLAAINRGELREQSLLLENAELKKPCRSRSQQILYDQARTEMDGLEDNQRKLLLTLIARDEMQLEGLHQELKRQGFSESEWAASHTRFREPNIHLVEFVHPTPMRPQNYVRINPHYREVLLELLHGRGLSAWDDPLLRPAFDKANPNKIK
jgi:hypothetical protein